MKDRGIDALVNDCLVGPVLTMGSTFVAYVCALLAFLYLDFTKPVGSLQSTVVLSELTNITLGLQYEWLLYPCGHGICLSHRLASVSDLHDAYRKRSRVCISRYTCYLILS